MSLYGTEEEFDEDASLFPEEEEDTDNYERELMAQMQFMADVHNHEVEKRRQQ